VSALELLGIAASITGAACALALLIVVFPPGQLF
jgi:hypothetical protein